MIGLKQERGQGKSLKEKDRIASNVQIDLMVSRMNKSILVISAV